MGARSSNVIESGSGPRRWPVSRASIFAADLLLVAIGSGCIDISVDRVILSLDEPGPFARRG
jgi:hypothetical protein